MQVYDNDNYIARNVIIFVVDKISSSHAGNRKNNFLELGEGPTFGMNGSFGSVHKKFGTNFIKANIKFFLILHYNACNSYLLFNRKSI